MECNGVIIYIDVIVDSLVSNAALRRGSAERVGSAAEQAELRKRRDSEG